MAEDAGETKAKASLFVKGFTDPNLTEIRSESPTLSRFSRHLTKQLSVSHGSRLRKGDVKTDFLSGDGEEARRDVHAEPPQEMRDKLQITREQVLKLETPVFGLRNAPRARWKRVVRHLTETGLVQHQLDQLGELTQLRGVSGSANWLANQTPPELCVSTSLLQGAHASATVADT